MVGAENQTMKRHESCSRDSGLGPLEMLKMKIDPAICLKTQVTVTKCPVKCMAPTRKYTDCALIDNKRADFFFPIMHGLARFAAKMD